MRALVNLREMLQSHINCQDLIDLPVGEKWHLVSDLERDRMVVTTALQTRAGPRMIDQDASHRLRGDRQERVAIRGGQLALLEESKVDLVDKCRRRECMAGRFAAKLSSGNLTQLIVNERDDSLRRLTIARAPSHKPLRDLAIAMSSSRTR